MREKIRKSDYVMTLHAEEELDDDDLSIFDIERVVLVGRCIERQRDYLTGEFKYLIEGKTYSKGNAFVVAKLSPTGKLVILTVYSE